jgi:hypothetical protein
VANSKCYRSESLGSLNNKEFAAEFEKDISVVMRKRAVQGYSMDVCIFIKSQ